MKLFFFLLLLLIDISAKCQTTVILKRTKKAIYVGADSRINIYKTDPATNTTYRDTGSMCKIWTNGKIGCAVIGMYITQSKEEAITACNKYASFEEITNKYANSFALFIRDRLTESRQLDSNYFSQLLNDNSPNFCQTFFFGKNADSLISYIVQFKVIFDNNNQVQVNWHIWQKDLLYAGHIKEIKDTVEKSKIWRKEKKIPKTIEALIKIESIANPAWVGGSTDIIKVTRKKIKWLQKKPMCD